MRADLICRWQGILNKRLLVEVAEELVLSMGLNKVLRRYRNKACCCIQGNWACMAEVLVLE